MLSEEQLKKYRKEYLKLCEEVKIEREKLKKGELNSFYVKVELKRKIASLLGLDEVVTRRGNTEISFGTEFDVDGEKLIMVLSATPEELLDCESLCTFNSSLGKSVFGLTEGDEYKFTDRRGAEHVGTVGKIYIKNTYEENGEKTR